MKNILLIATGGTIASLPTENGLAPSLNADEITACVPQLKKMCNISAVQPFSKDSTNMSWREWLAISAIIKDNYDKFDGFVITHGTDTLSYAAATLSYVVQNNRKPIVLTGAQKSIFDEDTDGRRNILQAFTYACDDRAVGTHVVFDGRVIVGTRARKTRTKSFNAFSSIDYPEVAVIRGDKLIFFIEEAVSGDVRFYDKLEPSVISVRLIPGMDSSVFDYVADNCKGVIVESFGVGGLPQENGFVDKLEKLLSKDVRVVMTTQVPHEGSDLAVYEVGNKIKIKYELIEAYDMTTEAIVAKMMWALAYSCDKKSFYELFRTPIAKDRLS